MKRTTLIFFILLISLQAFNQTVDKVEPPCWWIGFKEKSLQLMVYGKNIASLTPRIDYADLELFSVTKPQSPNYLFIDLKLNENTQPGNFSIDFYKDNQLITSYPYQLKKRKENSAARKGFDNSDVIYLLFPDRFANGKQENDNIKGYPDKINRDNQYGRRGGDIQGIENHLDYLKELGVTAVWTTPLLEDNQSEGSYHHYATTDYYKIDPRFGTNEEYEKMVETYHSQNMKVIMDMIPNHCGSEHAWMEDLPFDNWINGGTKYTQTNYRIATTNDPYVSDYDKNLNFNGWFVSEMPDLNQNNPFVLKYLKQFAIWWLEYSGIDGIRVDTYPYNEPEKIAKWTKAIMNEYPNLNIVGECWQHSPFEIAYWQSGTKNYNNFDSGLPSVMDFATHDAISVAFNQDNQGWNGGVGQLWNTLAQDYAYSNPYNLVIFTENHDTQRFSTVVNQDMDKYLMAYAYLLTTRGIPQLYYGSEIMMGGNKAVGDGDIRREMPGGWSDHKRSIFNPQQRTEQAAAVFNHLKKLIHWRNQKPVIHSGKLTHFIPEDNIYTYFRHNNKEKVMVILNNNKERKSLSLNRFNKQLQNYKIGKDVITEKIYNLNQPIDIQPKTALVLELN